MSTNTQMYLNIVVDIIGVLLIFVALLTHKLDDFSVKYRVAIALTGAGFLGQVAMLLQLSLVDHTSQTFHTYWLIKDIGVVLWFSFAFYDIQFKNLCLKIGKYKESANVGHT